jgi:hypothetical protein
MPNKGEKGGQGEGSDGSHLSEYEPTYSEYTLKNSASCHRKAAQPLHARGHCSPRALGPAEPRRVLGVFQCAWATPRRGRGSELSETVNHAKRAEGETA